MTLASRPLRIPAAAVLLALFAPAGSRGAAGDPRLAYPDSPKVSQTDDYHGTKVADPYRWLEDLDSAQAMA